MDHYQHNVMGERADCGKMAASVDVLDSAVRLCSDIHTSFSRPTLNRSTLSALTECAEFEMSVLLQTESSTVH